MRSMLVVGGAGFLGSNLCKKLVENSGNYVICMDNLHTGSAVNVADLIDSYQNFEYIEANFMTSLHLLDSIDIDEVYMLACPASPVAYQADPLYTIKINSIGTFTIADFALKKGARLLFTSTSEVYGNPLEHPQKESYWGNVNPVGVRSCYDESKRMSETILYEYKRTKKLNVGIVRIFNTYGPNMDKNDGRIISNFINQALNNNPITVYGDGSQSRSFCYVDDMIDGLVMLMNSSIFGPMNIGNPEECTVNDVAKLVVKLTGSKSAIINKQLPQDDPVRRKPDISFAKSMGWEPKVDFKTGLLKTVTFFKKLT